MTCYLIINNFEALWPKILPPDLKLFVYFFFYSPSSIVSDILEGNLRKNLAV